MVNEHSFANSVRTIRRTDQRRRGHDVVTYPTIEHALGSPRGRYFGHGHRGSTYTFTPTSLAPGRVVGICAVRQEGTWSAKEAGTVSRHLSTIDAVSLAGLALEDVLRLEPVSVESLFISDASIRAGSAATEDLGAIPLEAGVTWNVQTRALDCVVTVGTMKLTLTVKAVPSSSSGDASVDAPKFYAQHMQNRIQHISDLEISCDDGRMQARLGALTAADGAPHDYAGLQSSHDDLFSISEAIVCLAQLAQAMAYEFDQISRDESAVFWLRRLSVSLREPRLHVGRLVDVDVRLAKTNELRLGGQVWRTLRLAAESRSLTAVADVAHVLPKAVVA